MYTLLCSVSNIQNKQEKTQIKNALDKIQGVHDVGVNLETGTVKVNYNTPATAASIKDCLESTGFKIAYE